MDKDKLIKFLECQLKVSQETTIQLRNTISTLNDTINDLRKTIVSLENKLERKEVGEEVKSADYKRRIEELIEEYKGSEGYVSYYRAFELNKAIFRIIYEADTAISKHDWELAKNILEAVANSAESIINCGDDSAGELGTIVDECFATWRYLCEQNLLPTQLKDEIFELAITNFKGGFLKEWNWWWDWIKIAIAVANTTEKQDLIIKLINEAMNSNDEEWSAAHDKHTAQLCKLDVISINGTFEQQRAFMYENVENPDFRRKLLHIAWNEENYNEVLRLAMDGVECNANIKSLVDEWYKWELKVYRQNKDYPNTIKFLQYFFCEGGRLGEEDCTMESLYTQMKSLVPNEKWDSFVESLINEILKMNRIGILLYVYTKEKMWDKYMEYLRKAPSAFSIDDAPNEVWFLYKDELIHLYASCVREYFNTAKGRSSYNYGVSLLRNLINYGGQSQAYFIIAEQKSRTPRRPALLDELSKL